MIRGETMVGFFEKKKSSANSDEKKYIVQQTLKTRRFVHKTCRKWSYMGGNLLLPLSERRKKRFVSG